MRTSSYLSECTIAAIATATGGAISIIRISGPGAFAALSSLTRSEKLRECEPRKLNRTKLYNGNGEFLDDCLIARFVSPNSFTGEDLVEIQLHGGTYLAQKVMETLSTHGIRQALAGEFSFRAVRNGKMSLFQAQAIQDLISSENDNAISLALEKMSGAQNLFISELSSQLRTLACLGEIGIDFSDQDLDEVSLPHLKKVAKKISETLIELQKSYQRGLRIQEGIKAAVIGLPNAGKSSFFNAILGENRSIVSDIAGTTRDVVREKITLRGSTTLTLNLKDTAGLRDTDNPVEQLGIERSIQEAKASDLVLFLMDLTTSFEETKTAWDSLSVQTSSSSPFDLASKTIGILTKCDQVSPSQIAEFQKKILSLGLTASLATSSVQGTGIQEAVESIVEACKRWTHRKGNEVILTRIDHERAVNEALHHMHRALDTTEVDLFASDIRQALYSLEPLIGETLSDDILGQIFSNFCIGK